MKHLHKKKFRKIFDPISWTGHGSFVIKTDDVIETPIAVVFLGVGINPEKAKMLAEQKAERIVQALNLCKGMKL